MQRSDLEKKSEVELPPPSHEKRSESKQPKSKRTKLTEAAKGTKSVASYFKRK